MKKSFLFTLMISGAIIGQLKAQELKAKDVPAIVKTKLTEKYPESAKFKVTWEKEKGNFEANWGGKSGEANSAVFTPSGKFMELVVAIPIAQLPAPVAPYIKAHFKKPIKEAGKVIDADGKVMYEAELKGEKDQLFDAAGKFIKAD